MLRRRIQTSAALAPIAVGLAVTAIACSDFTGTTHPAERAQMASAVPAFERARRDPESVANAHNRWLDTVLARLRAERKATNRRVSPNRLCEVMNELAEEQIRNGTIRVRSERESKPVDARRPACSRAAIVAEAPAEPEAAPPRAAGWNQVDYIDTLLMQPYTTADLVGLPTIDDDLAELGVANDSIQTIVTNSSDSAEAVNALETYVQTVTPTDQDIADVIGEMAALTVSSTEYWSENWEEFAEEICDPDPAARSAGETEDPCVCEPEENVRSAGETGDPGECDPEGPPELRAKGQVDIWYLISQTAIADAESFFGDVIDAYEILKDLTGSLWQEAGQGVLTGTIFVPGSDDMQWLKDNLGDVYKQETVDRIKSMVATEEPPGAPRITLSQARKYLGRVVRIAAKGLGWVEAAMVAYDSGVGFAEAWQEMN